MGWTSRLNQSGPVSPSRMQELVRSVHGRLGSRAHFATGDEVPGSVAPPVDRRHAAEFPPTRLHAQGMPAKDFEALAAKAASNPGALTTEEVLILLDAGADPALVMPQVAFTPEQRDAIIRQVQRGEAVTPGQIERLRQTGAADSLDDIDAIDTEAAADAAVEPPAALPQASAPTTRPFADVGGGKLVGEDGSTVSALGDGEHFVYEDGTIVDVMGNVVGARSPGELTDSAASNVDNLAASAVEIADDPDAVKVNTTPNVSRKNPVDALGEQIFAATAPADISATSQRTLKSLLTKSQKFRNADGTYDPAFLAAINRDPAYAAARLKLLEQMAGVSNADRAAEQIDTAAQAVAATRAPKPLPAGRAASLQDVAAARQLVSESLPEGDWAALTEAFNGLSDEQRAAVLASLPGDTRAFLSGMLDPTQQSPSFLPNRVSETLRPVNDVDDLIAQREAAKAAGNQEEVAAINELLQGENAASQEDITDAIRAYNERRAAADLLRKTMIARNELVVPELERMRREFTPAPQAPAITPGARTPEFAAADVPQAEMPTAFDQAVAEANEARIARDRAAPGGGLSQEERAAALRVDKELRGAPLAFKGRDGRAIPMESRSRGDVGIESNDRRAINKASGLEDQVAAAQKEVNDALEAARSASGVQALAAAAKRVEAAQADLRIAFDALDKAYPARLVNERTGQVKPAPASIVSGEKPTPKGWVVERGRAAMSESRLNMGGQQQTFDDAVMAAVGFRPRPEQRLARSSDDLTSSDVASLHSEADDVFGEDAAELLAGDFDPDWSVNSVDLETTGAQKKSNLGGRQQDSRAEQAVQTLFANQTTGQTNPLALKNPDGTPTFADADAVAEDILSRNTIFKPGTANYEMAKSRLAGLIQRKFGTADADAAAADFKAATKSAQDSAAELDARDNLPSFDGVDEALEAARNGSPIQPVTGDNVADNLDASAVEIGEAPITPVEGTAKPVGDEAKPKGRRGKKAAAKTEEEVAKPAADSGDTPIQPVTGRRKTVEEIQSEADEIERATRREAIESGMSRPKADKAARAARKAHVDAEMAARNGAAPAATATKPDVAPVSGSGKPVGDAAPPAAAADATPSASTADDAADPAVKPVDGDTSTVKPDGSGAGSEPPKPPDRTAGTPPKPTPETPSRRWPRWPLVVGGVVIGGIAADRLSRSGGNSSADGWRLPPGAGGPPGGGPGGGPMPFPVGFPGDDGGALMEDGAPMTEEERVVDALARLRRARAMNTQEGPSQTVLNYHAGWR